jgi:predicted phage terminase large subunit-like protein
MFQESADPFAYAADLLDPPNGGDLQIAKECAGSLRRFIREAWPIIEPATEFVDNWYLDCIAEHLEAVSRGEILRLLINQPPRTTKSITSAVMWPAWDWLEHPALRWVYASYAGALAQRDSMKMRRLIKSEGGREDGTIFQRIGYQGVLRLIDADPWRLTADQDAKQKYETTETGMRLATSVDAMATGEGGNRIVVDDPTSAKQARSDLERARANTWWDETMSTRFNNAQAAAVIVMQRLHEEDLTGHLLGKGGWHHLCLPGEYEPSHPFVYPESVTLPSGRELPGDPRIEEGELLDPVRLGDDRLDELEEDLGSYGFAGQIQQRPAPEEGGMFKKHWWQRWTSVPPLELRVASWDMRFSDSQSESSSYVVGQVWGVAGADRYLLAQIRARLSFTETLKAVEALAKFSPTQAKLVERKANGEAVIDSLKKKIPGMLPIDPEGGKIVRAAAVQPTVEAGNVYIPDGKYIPAPSGYEPTTVDEFLHEHAIFDNGAHDDQVDAMSQALTWIENRPGPITSSKSHPYG